jgi:hypothetical protein
MEKEKIIAYIKQLREKADRYYQAWQFCQEHNFELEAKSKREIYDVISRIVLEMEVEFDAA